VSNSPASILTFGDILNRSDEQLFVGRAHELQLFTRWLSATHPPEFLNVSGVAGIGKSMLMRAFARTARDAGRLVVVVDGRRFAPTPAEFLKALIGSTHADAVGFLNALRVVVLIDGFDQLAGLTQYLQDEFLAKLNPDVKVVVAGRRSLDVTWAASNDAWHRLVRPLRLAGLSEDESQLYLRQRGVGQPALRKSILRATGGHPLALSLAANMVARTDVSDLAAAPDWHLVVHSLVEQLLGDVEDPRMRRLLLDCAMASEVGGSRFARLVNDEDNAVLFDGLCGLSLVRPAEHGLTLPGEVLPLLSGESRWRHAGQRRTRRRRRRRTPDQPVGAPGEPTAATSNGVVNSHLTGADADPLDAPVHLTRRERDVIDALARGHTSNRELAAELVITEGTANLHVKHILSKLGLSRRAQISTYLVRHGELDQAGK
jgi:DNA-binding CsgD family transcriptional regulator